MKYEYLTAFSVASALLLSAAIIDTADYRKAEKNLAESNTNPIFLAYDRTLATELNRITTCGAIRTEKYNEYTLETRACLLNAMSKTKTTTGSIVLAGFASEWLKDHPLDEEVRASALLAIESGRNDLIDSKKRYYDKMAKVSDKANSSFFYKLFNGEQDGTAMLDKIIVLLNEAEFSVRLPEVAQRQNEWKSMVFTG